MKQPTGFRNGGVGPSGSGRSTEMTVGNPEGDVRFVLIGGGQVGRHLADRLSISHAVHHLDTPPTVVPDPPGYETSYADDIADPTAIAMTGVSDGDVAVVLTRKDSRALMVTQILRTGFDVHRIYVILRDPRNRTAFDLPGVVVICSADVLSRAVILAYAGDDTLRTGSAPATSISDDGRRHLHDERSDANAG